MPTVSIRKTLAARPGDTNRKELTWQAVGQYLYANYLENDAEKKRKEKFAERQRLYSGSGDADIKKVIKQLLEDPDVQAWREACVEFAKFNNVSRRQVTEVACVYSMPAKRTVGKAPTLPEHDPPTPDELARFEKEQAEADEQNRRYHEVQRLSRQHEVMQRVDRMLELHRAVLVVPRMRQLPNGEWAPTIDVYTPAKFSAVRDPLDPSLLVGVILETDYLLEGEASAPKWLLLSWHEQCWLDSRGQVMEEGIDAEGKKASAIQEHGMGRIPAVFMTLEPPDGQLFDTTTGDERTAAHKSVAVLNACMLKEALSDTKQVVLTGDLTRAQRGQAQDSRRDLELSEGTQAQVIDRGQDWLKFADGSDRISETSGTNVGIAPQIMRGGAVASADARDLARVPIRESRLQRQIPLHGFERELAELLSIVVAQYRSDLAFSMEGWSIDFADVQTPLGTMEALTVLEKELAMFLTSELQALMERNRDFTYEQAKAWLKRIIEERTFRLVEMKTFTAEAGGLAQGAMPAEAKTSGAVSADDETAESSDDLSWVEGVLNAA